MAPNTPMSVGETRENDTVTVTLLNVLGGVSSCDAIARANVDAIQGAIEIVMTFPAGVSSGKHALSDIGGSATLRFNDQTCAATNDATTNGVIAFADTDIVSAIDLTFSSGRLIAFTNAFPMCLNAIAHDTPTTCTLLAPCPLSSSASCYEL